jgi:hypothetical protein
LLLVAGAIAFIELRLDAAPVTANSQPASNQPDAEEQAGTTPAPTEDASGPIDDGKGADTMREPSSTEAERAVADTKRIADKDDEYRRAEEIQAPSGFVNADGFSVVDAASENVILLECPAAHKRLARIVRRRGAAGRWGPHARVRVRARVR